MKTKTCLYPQLNYLPRTAIVREQKQFIKITFVVHLSAVISAERYRSDSGALKSAVFNFVFFIMLKNKIEQSAKRKLLLNNPTDRTFENRRSRYKELGKKVPQAYRVYVEETFLPCDAGDARIFSKEVTHTNNSGDNEEQKAKRYYYHSDHLGSAQFVTDWKGRQYEHIEYTPYGELWTYKSKTAMLFLTMYNNFLAKQPAGLIEEVAAGLDKLPFRFTGKELDEETGLYYYGARYLDPKYSRWLSGDPALGKYIPQAPINDEAKKHNENLPGMGGVFNTVNLHVYHYAGYSQRSFELYNPVKYVDPEGKITWNRAEDGDIHYNSLYNPDLRNCYAVFSINTEHYRATRETNTIKHHSYSLSGTKDIIEIRQGGIEVQTITTVTLKRFNINLDGKNYDVFKMEGESNIRLLFISNTKHLKSSFFANDPLGDDKSIYNGFYNLNNFIDFLKGEDTNKLAFAAISFGLAFFLNPVEANFTDGLFNHLSSKAEGQVPTTSGIDKDTLDLLSQIIEEYER